MSQTTDSKDWGRVDSDGTVYVRDSGGERAVGQYPDSTPDEALAYYVRKFEDLEGQVTLLEARIHRGTAGAGVTEQVAKLAEQLESPAAVGDIQSLRDRVAKLNGEAEELSEGQRKQREEARAAAIVERERIAAEAERLASQPEGSIRWKDTSQAFEQLFQDWQTSQKTGPHLPKSVADEYWKRFRNARQKFDSARRQYFAARDQQTKQVKAKKEALIVEAEKLADRGAEGIPAYRSLLDSWKQAGRANRKVDDALWARFKAAGDVLFEEKAQQQAKLDEEYQGNLEQKNALLDESEYLLKETDHKQAREALTKVQLRWDEIGRVPRHSLREVEDRLRKIEQHVKQLEDEHWRQTNPETKARSEGLRGQLEESIANLQSEVENASTPKAREEAQKALETQQAWLAALGDA